MTVDQKISCHQIFRSKQTNLKKLVGNANKCNMYSHDKVAGRKSAL